MMHVTIDGRDGTVSSGGGSGACATCCCEPVFLRPGECNLMVLNYAPWSVPMGGRGIVPTTQISIETNRDACSSQTIDTFGNPSAAALQQVVPLDSAGVAIDLGPLLTPVGNVFTFEWLDLYGPSNGTVINFLPDGTFTYVPNSGFNGYDYVWYKATDAQGRTIIRRVLMIVGTPIGGVPVANYGLEINRSEVVINSRSQELSFPICLSVAAEGSVDSCARYRVTIRQPANDCDRTFYHVTCFDVMVSGC